MKLKPIIRVLIACITLATVPMAHVHAGSKSVDCAYNPEKCQDDNNSNQPEEEEPTSTSPGQSSSDSPSIGWQIVKLVFAVLFIVVLIYGLLKFVNKRNKMFQSVKTLENIGGVSLGQNKSLQVVRIGEQYYAVGVGDNVELLTEITDEKTIQAFHQQNDQASYSASSILANVIPKTKQQSGKGEEKSSSSSVQFQQLFQSELNSLKQKRKKVMDQHQKQKEDSDE
ncbi:flagellar protein [Pontibacillus yanchengensis]|uniref:Flagellar protein n=2 Tax=Pontibacillus yanchengensis TaxID=462910 RepID=A0ACC7VAZ2_9BACI|nr:flagellar biosynthetic protein FliO [Pontibacillus yanchengensis]MYL33154.1 flagellar protein [Pontibacillus yanchengensis]MYL51996.1 flagellar protein [Pontibacillus yanchengensis]